MDYSTDKMRREGERMKIRRMEEKKADRMEEISMERLDKRDQGRKGATREPVKDERLVLATVVERWGTSGEIARSQNLNNDHGPLRERERGTTGRAEARTEEAKEIRVLGREHSRRI